MFRGVGKCELFQIIIMVSGRQLCLLLAVISFANCDNPLSRSKRSPNVQARSDVYEDSFTKSFNLVANKLQQIEETVSQIRSEGLDTQKATSLILDQIFRPSCHELATYGPPPLNDDSPNPSMSHRPFTGVSIILPPKSAPVSVRCESNSKGDGWTVILSRSDGSENFNRTYEEYRRGFGDPRNEYYIGNEALHKLTAWKPHMLRVELEDFAHTTTILNYFTFQLSNATMKYQLNVQDFDKSCGVKADGFQAHSGMPFSTLDMPTRKDRNCALEMGGGGGWWYENCYNVLGTGTYRKSKGNQYGGLAWWPVSNVKHSLRTFKMMIRPSPRTPSREASCTS